ncbi:hypothetical protein M422DRAFT_51936 [Sphaerobolus stellatus SS14]|uniref:MCM C-terminal AAA(+) ATPase domain-containing protein n=1 Tax=Sphaerobolus stellatus (strain SS14) TaxID=990650 RepID=A0A0C9TWE4_SPHS4|nr:hypothetical protein M422DRAFT_51936 [Sphaerobolus stellatus SS14]
MHVSKDAAKEKNDCGGQGPAKSILMKGKANRRSSGFASAISLSSASRDSASEDFYERFTKSVAPSIFGTLDIKKAITCLLFGSSKKIFSDRMRLRGDFNVLLLGDLGSAKSQLLKFVGKVAPITSSKSLSVDSVRPERPWSLSLVVCIDEFAKMRDDDEERVAIHDAMELADELKKSGSLHSETAEDPRSQIYHNNERRGAIACIEARRFLTFVIVPNRSAQDTFQGKLDKNE